MENEGCQGVKPASGFCFCLRPNSQAEKTMLHKTFRALNHVERQAARQLNINDNIGFAQIPYIGDRCLPQGSLYFRYLRIFEKVVYFIMRLFARACRIVLLYLVFCMNL